MSVMAVVRSKQAILAGRLKGGEDISEPMAPSFESVTAQNQATMAGIRLYLKELSDENISIIAPILVFLRDADREWVYELSAKEQAEAADTGTAFTPIPC